VWNSFAASGGEKRSTTSKSCESCFPDGSQMSVGATSEAEVASIIAQGGRRGEIYSKLYKIRQRYAGLIRELFPQIPRRVSGYNLDELLPEKGFHVARALVGTEGTCAIVLEAKLKLIHSPQHRTLVGLGYEDAFSAADHVPEILRFGPIGLEGFEGSIVDGLQRKGSAKPGSPSCGSRVFAGGIWG